MQSPHSPTGPRAEEEEPPTKRFCHLSQILENRPQQDINTVSKKQPGEEEMERYLATVHSLSDDVDPIVFRMLIVFLGHLCRSSMYFRQLESTSGKRNHSSDKNFERSVTS